MNWSHRDKSGIKKAATRAAFFMSLALEIALSELGSCGQSLGQTDLRLAEPTNPALAHSR